MAFTHTHIDHTNGLVLPSGEAAFPNLSRLLVPRAEMELFRGEPRLERYHGRAEPLDGGQRIDAHIEAVAAPGHEVGHSYFRVTSGSEVLLIWGDLVHVPSVQFDRPEITWEVDADQDMARAPRGSRP